MKKLKELIEEEIMFPLSPLVGDRRLVPLYDSEDESYLFASEEAIKEGVCLVQGDINRFLQIKNENYHIVGMFGHGLCSHALTFQTVDSWRKVFLRIPYKNAFDDPETSAQVVRQYLFSYFEFERKIRDKVDFLIFVDSMYSGYVRISMKNRKPIKGKGSCFKNPELWEKILNLVEGDNNEEI